MWLGAQKKPISGERVQFACKKKNLQEEQRLNAIHTQKSAESIAATRRIECEQNKMDEKAANFHVKFKGRYVAQYFVENDIKMRNKIQSERTEVEVFIQRISLFIFVFRLAFLFTSKQLLLLFAFCLFFLVFAASLIFSPFSLWMKLEQIVFLSFMLTHTEANCSL